MYVCMYICIHVFCPRRYVVMLIKGSLIMNISLKLKASLALSLDLEIALGASL